MLRMIRDALLESTAPQVAPQATPQVAPQVAALAAGLIEMTLPGKPYSPLQKYRRSASGAALLAQLERAEKTGAAICVMP